MTDPPNEAGNPTRTKQPSLADVSGSAPVIQTSASRYEILGEIARGGMGTVYRAADSTLHREVALKVLQDQFAPDSGPARRFVDEARIAGQLQHPGIPAVHELGTLPDGRPFLAMKLIKGCTLNDLLKGPGPGPHNLVAIFEQACQAVGYAHAHNVIHRDLKPTNVMVGAFGEVQVLDWGLAKLLGPAAMPAEPTAFENSTVAWTEIRPLRADDDATRAGSVLGTPAFMPPEQAIGAIDQVDKQSDVFGLGAILCAVLTGKPPYVGANFESTRQLAARARLDDAFSRLDSCGADPGLVALCKQCLAAEKAGRPNDAGEVASAVAKLRAAADERARQAELDRAAAAAEAREQRKRRRVQLALAAAVGLLLLAGGMFAVWRERRATDERARLSRNSDAVVALLSQCEDALRADDADKARLMFDQAETRASEGGAESLADRFERCRIDLALLRELDQFDALRWTWAHGNPPPVAQIEEGWAVPFARWGLQPGATSVQEASRRLNDSSIRDRALASLDGWLSYSRSTDLLAILRATDSNGFRDAIREAIAAGTGPQVARLAGQPEALDQPARFAAFLGVQGAVQLVRQKQILGVALQRRPGDFNLLMTRGSLKSNTPAERETWFRAAVAVRPGNAVAHQNLAHALRASGDLDGAVAEFKEMVRLDPKLPWAHHWLVGVWADKDEIDAAVTFYEEALRLHPNEAWARMGLACALNGKGDVDAAIRYCKESIELDANYIAYNTLGAYLLLQRDFDGAVAAAEEAIRLNPNFIALHNLKGDALLAKGDVDGAITAYKAGLRHDPMESTHGEVAGRTHVNLAHSLRIKGDLDGARAILDETMRLYPKNATARVQIGHVLKDKGDLDGAIEEYRKAIQLDPKAGNAWHNLGIVLYDKKDYDGAIAAYKKFFEIQPKYAPAYSDLGSALMRKGDVDGAVAAFKKGIQLDPNWAPANRRWMLGNALIAQGKPKEAVTALREALTFVPLHAWAHQDLGVALRRLGNIDEAIYHNRQAIRSDPKFAFAHDTFAGRLRRGQTGSETGVRQWSTRRRHVNSANGKSPFTSTRSPPPAPKWAISTRRSSTKKRHCRFQHTRRQWEMPGANDSPSMARSGHTETPV
jgi:tetratricopeptide (TPR) repeat protein